MLLRRRHRLDRTVSNNNSRTAGTVFVWARHELRTQDRKGRARIKVKDKVRLRKEDRSCLRRTAPWIKT